MSENEILKVSGALVAGSYLVVLLAVDWLSALSNERHVEAHPRLLKNEAVGETVTVSGDFRSESGLAKGLVVLHGERWKAICSMNPMPRDGDSLEVCGREGLTLIVQQHGSDI